MQQRRWAELSPDEKKAAALDGRRRGLSASQIADELQAESRNAILGAFHRIARDAERDGSPLPAGFDSATSARRRLAPIGPRANPWPDPEAARPAEAQRAATRPTAAKRAQTVAPAAAIDAPATGEPVDLEVISETAAQATGVLTLHRTMSTECPWPVGDWDRVPIEERRCCGKPIVRRWCTEHEARAFAAERVRSVPK
jgi:hypothetical protein